MEIPYYLDKTPATILVSEIQPGEAFEWCGTVYIRLAHKNVHPNGINVLNLSEPSDPTWFDADENTRCCRVRLVPGTTLKFERC